MFTTGLLLALCPVFSLVISSSADTNCLAELSYRPTLFLMQLLNHLIFRQIPCTAEIHLPQSSEMALLKPAVDGQFQIQSRFLFLQPLVFLYNISKLLLA